MNHEEQNIFQIAIRGDKIFLFFSFFAFEDLLVGFEGSLVDLVGGCVDLSGGSVIKDIFSLWYKLLKLYIN